MPSITKSDQSPETGEVYVLDLDWDVILHLAQPESVAYFQSEGITVNLFEDALTRKVFEWQMSHLREHGRPASATVIEAQFSDVTIEKPETAVGDLIGRLRERYIRNEGRTRIKHLAEIAVSDPLSVSRELSKEARHFTSLTAKRGERYGTGDAQRALAEYDNRVTRGLGPSLGYQALDDHFHGMLGVTFLMAAPKTCKSWFCINAVAENVIQGRFPYLYSLELPAVESEMRLLCMAAGVPYWKFLKGCLTEPDRQAIGFASQGLDGKGVYEIEKPQKGERQVTQMIERAIDRDADCIFIDQLQYVENDKGNSLGALNNTGDYFDAVNEMRNYSDEIPIFVVHQFNRSVMGAKGMPEMQQGKGSSAIEEVSTLALGLWANKDMRRNSEIELGTLASRNYSYESWRLGVELSTGCSLELKYRLDDDD